MWPWSTIQALKNERDIWQADYGKIRDAWRDVAVEFGNYQVRFDISVIMDGKLSDRRMFAQRANGTPMQTSFNDAHGIAREGLVVVTVVERVPVPPPPAEIQPWTGRPI